MSEAILLLLRINLAGAAAIAAVMALRLPVRRLFGAGAAYALWWLPALAVGAMLPRARVITLIQPVAPRTAQSWAQTVAVAPLHAAAAAFDWRPVLAALWLAGAAASLGVLAWRQWRFTRTVRKGHGGPAVIGVLRPRIVTPADFASRYTEREQRMVMAHERTHIARHDSRINAAVALIRCGLWFNPFIHVAARTLRIDQEIACDAAVIAAHPSARRAYAEALLKTQLAVRPLPLGCYWPARAAHPLAQRIGLLTATVPPGSARLGAVAVALLTLTGAWTAWAVRPAEVVFAATTPAPALRIVAAAAPAPRPAITARRRADDTGPARHPALTQVDDAAPAPVANPGLAEPDDAPRLMPPGLFGPDHRFRTAASWSRVEPGSAVRVIATMTDPQGIPLTTDLTAFGSQSWYRLGYISSTESRYKLFTSVAQHGERLVVTAGLDRSFSPLATGSVELASGETGTITLPNGLSVTVTPILRAETEGEREATRPRPFINVERIEGL